MLRNLLLALAALAISLALAELAVRALHLAPGVTRIEIRTPWAFFVPSADPILLYEPKPGSRDVNAYGVRDFPFSIQKPPGTFRIVVIGDSIAFGFCNESGPLALDRTFPKLLERSLRERLARPIEVLNLSVSGYDTVQEVEFLVRKGLVLEPDLVIVAYCLNDAWTASAEQATFERIGLGRLLGTSEVFQRLYLSSGLLRFAMQRTRILGAALSGATGAGPVVDRTTLGFERLAALGAAHGFSTLVATFPLFEDWQHYGRAAEHRAVAEKAAAQGFYYLDLLPPFRVASHDDARALQGRCNREHPDEAGHAVAARAIEAYLLEHGLVGGAAAGG